MFITCLRSLPHLSLLPDLQDYGLTLLQGIPDENSAFSLIPRVAFARETQLRHHLPGGGQAGPEQRRLHLGHPGTPPGPAILRIRPGGSAENDIFTSP